jgi:hypothetical protein
MAKRNQLNRPDLSHITQLDLNRLRVNDTLKVTGELTASSGVKFESGLYVAGNTVISGSLSVGGVPITGGGGASTVKNHHSTDVSVSPGNTLYLKFFSPESIAVKNIKLYSETSLGSAAGTYLFTATGDGNSLIASTYDLETLAATTLTDVTLSTTTADLSMSAGDVVNFTFTSNNADLTGSGLYLQMLWEAV